MNQCVSMGKNAEKRKKYRQYFINHVLIHDYFFFQNIYRCINTFGQHYLLKVFIRSLSLVVLPALFLILSLHHAALRLWTDQHPHLSIHRLEVRAQEPKQIFIVFFFFNFSLLLGTAVQEKPELLFCCIQIIVFWQILLLSIRHCLTRELHLVWPYLTHSASPFSSLYWDNRKRNYNKISPDPANYWKLIKINGWLYVSLVGYGELHFFVALWYTIMLNGFYYYKFRETSRIVAFQSCFQKAHNFWNTIEVWKPMCGRPAKVNQ